MEELPPVTPFTCHTTAVLLVFSTVAANCWVWPTAGVADVGTTATLTAAQSAPGSVASARSIVNCCLVNNGASIHPPLSALPWTAVSSGRPMPRPA